MKSYIVRITNAEGGKMCQDRVVNQHQRDSIIASHEDNGWTKTTDGDTLHFTKGRLDHTCTIMPHSE